MTSAVRTTDVPFGGVSSHVGRTSVVRDGIEWQVDAALVAYDHALATMDARVAAIRNDGAPDLVWLLEHPPLYTGGTSARASDLLDARLPIYTSGRGGRHTYHGPGQRVGYVMLDLARRGRDVRRYVAALEAWIIAALGLLSVDAFVVPGRVGVWTSHNGNDAKIAAIGVRLRHWVTLHGFAINVMPDLAHFNGIVPCGLDLPVTSLAALGCDADLARLDAALMATAGAFLGTREAA